MLKDLLKCLSLINLLFFSEWSQLLQAYSGSFAYYRKVFPNPIYVGSVVADILLLSLASWIGLLLVRHYGGLFAPKILHAVFVLVFVTPLNTIVFQLSSDLHTYIPSLGADPLTQAGRGTLLCGGIILLSLAPTHVLTQLGQRLLLILSPLFFVSLSYIAWAACSIPGSALRDKILAPPLPQHESKPHVVVLIFDELDQRLVFENRPADVFLPTLDSFSSQSILASHAYSPARDTIEAIPSIVNGRTVSKAVPLGPDELELTFKDTGHSALWSSQPNLFSAARAIGANSALAGWHHPYCRILAGSLSQCSWDESVAIPALQLREETARRAGLGGSMRQLAQDRLDLLSLSSYVGRSAADRILTDEMRLAIRSSRLGTYSSILGTARQMVTNPALNLIFIHWPVPHAPGIYDRSRDAFSLDPTVTYFDNLELVDKTLAQLKQDLQGAGLWNDTTVLVTSDHSLRAKLWQSFQAWPAEAKAVTGLKEDPRVPFLLKAPGQTQAIRYDEKFSTILIHDLVLALLNREISTAAGIVAWLERAPRGVS